MYSCCFIGHKNCPKTIEATLLDALEKLITEYSVTTFYVGTQGSFDRLVYNSLCYFETLYKINIKVILAYLNKENGETYYDMKKTFFPDELTNTPPRFAIRKRNSYMINKSDFVVTFLNDSLSNTYTNVEEAKRKNKIIINIGDYDIKKI